MAFQNEYAAYYGRPNPFKDPSTISDTNWQDYIFRSSAPITDHNLSVSRSMKDSNYFLSVNYFNQDGIMYESGFERYQIRFNVDQNIGKFLQLGATLTASMTNRDNPILGGHNLLPTAPIYNEDGSYFDINQISGNVFNNPVAQKNCIQDKTRTYRGLGNLYAQLTLFKNLILKHPLVLTSLIVSKIVMNLLTCQHVSLIKQVDMPKYKPNILLPIKMKIQSVIIPL